MVLRLHSKHAHIFCPRSLVASYSFMEVANRLEWTPTVGLLEMVRLLLGIIFSCQPYCFTIGYNNIIFLLFCSNLKYRNPLRLHLRTPRIIFRFLWNGPNKIIVRAYDVFIFYSSSFTQLTHTLSLSFSYFSNCHKSSQHKLAGVENDLLFPLRRNSYGDGGEEGEEEKWGIFNIQPSA